MDRNQLLDALCKLLPAQQELVIAKLRVPSEILRGTTAAPAMRMIDLLDWADQQQRQHDVEQVYLEVRGGTPAAPLTHGPARQAALASRAAPQPAADPIDPPPSIAPAPRFFHGNPVPPASFVGRGFQRRRLRDLIAGHGQSAAIVGEPRMGRSSLLKLLASPVSRAEIQQRSRERLLFGEVNGENIADGFERAKFWGHVFAQIEDDGPFLDNATLLGARYRECVESGFDSAKLERLMSRMHKDGYRLVLFIDDLDHLVGQHAGQHFAFFAGLRSLSQLTQPAVLTYVCTSRHGVGSLNALAGALREQHLRTAAPALSRAGSPLFNNIHEVSLEALTEEEVDQILGAARDRFTAGDRSLIHRAAGGQPSLVQAAADALWNAYEHGRAGAAARREALSELARVTDNALWRAWAGWPESTRYALTAIGAAHLEALGAGAGWPAPDAVAAGVIGEDLAILRSEIEALEKRGFVWNRGGYRIRPMAFLSWLAVRLRTKSQSPRLWSDWMREEGWDAVIPPPRRKVWDQILRARCAAVETDLQALLAADAAPPRVTAPAPRPAEPAPPPFRATPPARPVRIFCSYAPADDHYRVELEKHLAALRREGGVETWGMRDVTAGDDWRGRAHAELMRADVILLLLSADFLANDYRFSSELKLAQERLERDEVRVVPIRVRPCDAGDLWFTKLDALPGGSRAITEWPHPDEAWREVAQGIRAAVAEIAER